MSNEIAEVERENLSEYDAFMLSALEESGIANHLEKIFFMSQDFVEKTYPNKPYNLLVSESLGKISSKYNRNIDGYKHRMDDFLKDFATIIDNVGFLDKRINDLYKLINNAN